MIRNLKVLSLAVVALALTAVAASAASAAQFDASTSTVEVQATQVNESHVFTVDGQKVTCKQAKFATYGEVPAPSTPLTVHPEYGECMAFGFIGATIHTTGCDYVLHASGTVDVECAPEKSIVITISTCEAEVGAQTGLESVSYTNNATSPSTVTVSGNVRGIAVNKTKDGFLCPLSGTGHSLATYVGDTLAQGFSEGNQVGISFTP